ncbi:Alpha/Beta hydrolase protein [Phascolomyces articulosus]|uniref:Alpha/Beta hydrolase protein n=1 Tax=Phascolomyces articulosus TaxID=60185 RepID=A0AAD5K496_9FUNG|nr:Alpha/Beta hydrolase protein [Phascolomyces articulosus]
MSIEPFEIPSIPPERLALLNEKLKNAEYPNELETGVGWKYGAPRWAVEPLVQAWLKDYDWEKARNEMNRLHHYHATIDGLRIHFIHEPSNKPDAIPLLLMNGWPSNFYEFHKVIQPLRDGGNGNEQVFHVVIPSLPGYGFSEAPKIPGYGIAKYGEMMNELMITIGYKQYLLAGSDWGSIIGNWMARHCSENCKGFHNVMPLCLPPTPTITPSLLWSHPVIVAKYLASIVIGTETVYGKGTEAEELAFADLTNDPESGYRAIQGTRPYTLSFGLTDSPVGLLAWMLEKFHNWSDHGGRQEVDALPDTISTSEFLTLVTIYWMTNSMPSSTRLYYEAFHEDSKMSTVMGRVRIPTAIIQFPAELAKFPRDWIEASVNLQQYSEPEVGGHFPSLETSELLVNDIQRFGKLLKMNKWIDY